MGESGVVQERTGGIPVLCRQEGGSHRVIPEVEQET